MTRNKKTVLVVDDDELHLYTTKELLQNEEIEVITHRSWIGATNRVKEVQPDLVLLDVNMPGLSGDGLASLLRRNNGTSGVPIVFHSSNDEDSLKELVRSHKVEGYICKGDVAELRRKVEQYLASQNENGGTLPGGGARGKIII